MWIFKLQLFTVICCLCAQQSNGLEKDVEVTCLDSIATTITEGGVIANCALYGLTRTSTISPWLSKLANVLQGVNASHNHIKKVTAFPVLPRVLTLTLRHNSIRDIEAMAFTGLENLQSLDLGFNRITGDSLEGVFVGKKAPERYEPLPIRILFLSHNDISSIKPTLFEHLRYLRDLHLDFNPITAFDENFSAALRNLPELKMLNLAGTGLSSLPKDAFSEIELTSLLLNGNQFTQVPDLSTLKHSLRLLNINQNPIKELDASSFSGLDSVSEIVASGMPELTAVRSGTFTDLDNIRVVSCTYNPQLTSIEEDAFWNHKTSKHTSLQEVYLNNNALPRIRKHLLPWLRLHKVTLDGNKWECDCRLHWLATFLRSRNTTIDRFTELKCWEPIWLNGTQLVFWDIDTQTRLENFPCLADIEEERLEIERQKLEYQRKEQLKNAAILPTPEPEESNKSIYLIAILALVALVILIGTVVAFNKYRNYRPIYHVEKMSSPMHNEMKYMKGSLAERTQLVS